jgi:biopolymer transport protein ExbD
VDPAPVVAVLFLLVIFMLLASLVYTPGVLVKFSGFDSPGDGPILTVTRDNQVIFAGKTNSEADLAQFRDGDLKDSGSDQPIRLVVEPGADPKFVEKVRGLFPVQLPDADNLAGTDNPTVVVAVNFRGQYFFENSMVSEAELRAKLRQRLHEAASESKKLTLVLWADKAAENDVVMRLYRLGRDAGITEFLLAEHPRVFGAGPARSRP